MEKISCNDGLIDKKIGELVKNGAIRE